MARIPEAEIERLKEAVPVARLAEASGVELKKGGKDMLGRCPFHEDATASLVMTPAKNLWHCFGCGVGGGPIDHQRHRQRTRHGGQRRHRNTPAAGLIGLHRLLGDAQGLGQLGLREVAGLAN